MRVLEIPDMLRKYDVEPVVMAGFATRGNEFPDRPEGALRHWTAGSLRLGIPSLRTLTEGRGTPGSADYLPGPLCEVGQERADPSQFDRAYCIASGKANHAGAGYWHDMDSNYDLLGLEIEWAGPTEAFSAKRRDVSERIMRALLDCCDNPADNADMAAEHREFALPAGRKQDTNLDGNFMRSRMVILRKPAAHPEEEEDMPTVYIRFKDNRTSDLDDYAKKIVHTINEKPVFSGAVVYGVTGGIGVWQTNESLALARYFASLNKTKISEVGTPTDPVEIIEPDGKPNNWFAGCHLIDGPLAGIKK